jgi:hypothetical protein
LPGTTQPGPIGQSRTPDDHLQDDFSSFDGVCQGFMVDTSTTNQSIIDPELILIDPHQS